MKKVRLGRKFMGGWKQEMKHLFCVEIFELRLLFSVL